MAKTDHIRLKIDLLDVKIDKMIHILNGINEDIYCIFCISESFYIFNGTSPSQHFDSNAIYRKRQCIHKELSYIKIYKLILKKLLIFQIFKYLLSFLYLFYNAGVCERIYKVINSYIPDNLVSNSEHIHNHDNSSICISDTLTANLCRKLFHKNHCKDLQ